MGLFFLCDDREFEKQQKCRDMYLETIAAYDGNGNKEYIHPVFF